ncbi:hypothetical protein, partial [Klebsiella pneumoniae]|uniref:hypothetical protein n=1 Tax=Klebsiella pneumoniae TaxID=573 RepID=UPI0015F2B1B3
GRQKAVAPGCDCLHIDAWNDDNIKRALVACQNAQPLPAQRSEILIMAKERNCRRCEMSECLSLTYEVMGMRIHITWINTWDIRQSLSFLVDFFIKKSQA